MTEELSARISLLDAQLVDCERLPIGRIDDLELEVEGRGPSVTAILTGSEALGQRIGGLTGAAMAAISARVRIGSKGPTRLDPALVEEILPLVRLGVRFADLEEVAGLEHWLERHVVGKLPGSGHEAE
jgi:hypothetical protein